MTLKNVKHQLNQMNPVDLADYLEGLDHADLVKDILLVEKDLLADAFALLSSDKKMELVNHLTDDKVLEIVKELESEELVDTVQELPANLVNKLLLYMDPEKEKEVHYLLGYGEDSVGSIMTVNYLRYKEDTAVSTVLTDVQQSEADPSKLELIWVTDHKLKLQGFVYLADLIRTGKQTLAELYTPFNVYLSARDDFEHLMKVILKYNFSDLPVVDSEQRLVGVVPTEWTVRVLSDEFGEDLYNLVGITEQDEEKNYADSSIWSISKSRVSWLIICLLTATVTSFIIQHYEATLASSVLLAAYIPMLMDSGGNAGSQSSTTIIQALSNHHNKEMTGWQVVLKELNIGLLVGGILVAVNLARMVVVDQAPANILWTVSVTLWLTIILSKVLGGLLPVIAKKVHIDPTVMSGPLITTVVDTLVLVVYFEVAQLMIGF